MAFRAKLHAINDKKFFLADRILAKHDENYIPPELKEIKKND